MSPLPVATDPGPSRVPTTSPRGRVSFALALLGAAALGLGAGLWPVPVLMGVLGVLVAGVLLMGLEWAVLAVVSASVFVGYLALIHPQIYPGLVLVMFGAWVLRRSRGPLPAHPPGPVTAAAALFLVVLVVSAAAQSNGQAGLEVVLRYVGHVAMLIVLADCARTYVAPTQIARAYVTACSAAGALGLLTSALSQRRVHGPLAEPHELAFFLLAAIPLACGLRRTARRPVWYDAAIVVMLAATIGTLSRAALVGLVAMVVFATVTRMISARVGAGIVVITGTGIAFLLAAFPQVVVDGLGPDPVAPGVSQTWEPWRAGVTMTADHPVLGTGPGGLALYHQDYRVGLAADLGSARDVAHSTYLQASAELGVLGLAALVAVWGCGLAGAWARWRRDAHPLAGATSAALVSMLVAALFVTEQFALPLWLLAALGAAWGRGGNPTRPASLVRLHATPEAR